MSFDVAGMLQYFRERHVNAISGPTQGAPGGAPAADFPGALETARTGQAGQTAQTGRPATPPQSPASGELRLAFNPSEIRLPVDRRLRSPEAPAAELALPSAPSAGPAASLSGEAAGQKPQYAAVSSAAPDALSAEEEARLTDKAGNDLAAIARHNAKFLLAAKRQAVDAKPERIKDLDPVQNQNLAPGERLLSAAKSLLGRPYQSGGESPRAGFDCSGFTSYVYGKCGVELPRNSRGQFAEGREIAPSELKNGDLVFFGGKKHISHVGIYAGDGKFIHSGSETGHVKISDLSDPYWKGRLAGCRRLL